MSRSLVVVWTLLLALTGLVSPSTAATTGKVQGKIVATDTGEPIGYASVQLTPADTTQKPLGRMSNADGTFLIEAPAGRYKLQIMLLSYAKKTIDVEIVAGQILPVNAALTPEAIQQKEIVVEAKAKENNEISMLAARKKATAVGDAVSAEQVQKSPDKNAAEVLRRVTGLSVSDGKYVFVRGMGERYSSTDVDGVRIASPEENKRVVPLDLFPSNLIENVVVQKTYTADRSGEFGGGDVQIHTKDFPGGRTWSLSIAPGVESGVTFHDRRGNPAGSEGIPAAVNELGGGKKLIQGQIPQSTLVDIGRAFSPIYSPRDTRTIPNATYTGTYGDEYQVFGHPLGLITSFSYDRHFYDQTETERLFRSASADTVYNYDVSRSTASKQLGTVGGLSYRISPSHSVHLRGLYTKSSDDEVRVYEGADHTRNDESGNWLIHRSTRLLYVERSILSGTLEGNHDFPTARGLHFDWKLTRSQAKREQPDRREVIYDKRSYYDFGTNSYVSYWSIGSQGNREYGDLHDDGWGGTGTASMPFKLSDRTKGKVMVGYDQQKKDRRNEYRRFQIYHNTTDSLLTLSPDSLFATSTFDGSPSSAYVIESTFNDSRFTDNYHAQQKVKAGFLSTDLTFGSHLRGNLGVRVEDGFQDVKSYDPFNNDSTVQEGKLENTDWLPSGNVTWGPTDRINVRLAASRTISRPDLNELSPSPTIEYEGGAMKLGNPSLKRARIDNYDIRFEMFPSLSEVLAVGFFYKDLHDPIELVIKGSSDPLVFPQNSDRGHNNGVELEARSGLGRLWNKLHPFSVNANATFISSQVFVATTSQNGSQQHPLQGQANYLVNGALTYALPQGRFESTVLLGVVGKRLAEIGFAPLPDIYEQPVTSLDATMAWSPMPHSRVKFSAKNMLDPQIRQLQGTHEVSVYHAGRSFSLGFSYGY